MRTLKRSSQTAEYLQLSEGSRHRLIEHRSAFSGRFSAIRYRRSRAAATAVSPGAVMRCRRPAADRPRDRGRSRAETGRRGATCCQACSQGPRRAGGSAGAKPEEDGFHERRREESMPGGGGICCGDGPAGGDRGGGGAPGPPRLRRRGLGPGLAAIALTSAAVGSGDRWRRWPRRRLRGRFAWSGR